MTTKELAQAIALEFLVNGWTWNFPDGERVPTETDITDALEALRANTPDGHMQILGRMVATNSDGHFDVYLFKGELS